MKKVIIGAILGAVVLFVWGFIYWSVLPIGPMIFDQVVDEETLAGQLKESIPQAGTYYLPAPELMTSNVEEFTRRHEAGPVATIFIYPTGQPVMPPSTFLLGFLSMLGATFFMGLVLYRASSALTSFGSRVGFVVTAGLIGVSLSDLGPPIWYWFPWSLWVATAVFHVTGWIGAGLVMAKLVPQKA